MKQLLKYLYIFFFGILFLEVSASNRSYQQNVGDVLNLDRIYFLEDPTNKLTVEQILQQKPQFNKTNFDDLTFGYSASTYWLKFTVPNITDDPIKYVLSILNPDLNTVEFYETHKGKVLKVIHSGEEVSLSTREIPNNNFLFYMDIDPLSKNTYYVKVINLGDSIYIPFRIDELGVFHEQESKKNMLVWLVYGILFFVVIFNLYMYKSLKAKLYLYYSLYILFGFLTMIVIDGYHAYLNLSAALNKPKIIIIAMYVFSLIVFAQSFLELRLKFPRVNTVANVLKIVAIVSSVFYFFDYPISPIPINLLPIIMMVTIIAIIVFSVMEIKTFDQSQYFFLGGFVALIVGVAIIPLKDSGFVPINLYTENALRLGMMLETILLTISVLERFRIQQEQANKTIQENYLQIQQQQKDLELANVELRKLSIVASNTDNAVAIYNDKGHIEWCNTGFESLYGASLSEIGGSQIHASEITGNVLLEEELEKVYVKNVPVVFSSHTKLKNGKEVWTQTTLTAFQDSESGETKVISIDSDITVIKKAQFELETAKEKAEESDRLKSAFLSNISHEIRTPLNAILGFSELLMLPSITVEKSREFLTLIRNNGQHLLRLISDIIDISRIQSGEMEVHNNAGNLNKLLSDIKKLYENNLKNTSTDKNIEFKLSFMFEDDHSEIFADIAKLRHIISNLVDNAVKFTNTGYINLGYTLKDDNLILFVKDTGIGIEPDKLSEIFENFRQVETGLNRKYDGTGMGLSLSKGLVEKIGGKIWVETRVNVGSTFYVSLPAEILNIKFPMDNHSSSDSSTYDFNGINVLVVEDMDVTRELLQEILKDTGCNLDFAETGNLALQMFDQKQYDIVLMDIRLPDIDGYEVTKMIRNKNKSVRIIAQTANAMDKEKSKCFDAGCNDYVAKPYKMDEILGVIQFQLKIYKEIQS